MTQSVPVLDFGAQTAQLIVRRIRELGIYSELLPHDVSEDEVHRLNPCGLVLSGGAASVYDEDAPQLPSWVRDTELPVLGICYGMQLQSYALGGQVSLADEREYGPATIELLEEGSIFAHTPREQPVWMSHGDRIEALPPGFRPLARTTNAPFAAAGNDARRWYGIQFHPEVVHTRFGRDILRNFLYDVCGCTGDWKAANIVHEAIERIRTQVGHGHVICALSGGVDSAVAALLMHRAVGDQLTCVFVDNGLLRQGEAEQVVATFQEHFGIQLIAIPAAEEFLSALDGVADPERKRKIIGEKFIRVFERESQRIGDVQFLAQGTLYPDVIESRAPDRAKGVTIKTHHNVGGLPDDMQLTLVEPLRYLFKDEVRATGLELGLPEDWVWRHPFPGPGLAVRVLGPVTWERLETLRQADAIFIGELRDAGLYRATQQAFAVLLPIQSVGVMGDGRTYADVVALRAITTEDYMTADWARLPEDLLARVSSRIVNEVQGVNRVVYDISSKPPSTIEWE
ncbi:MAG: glutamine-hydrolyzing GMP synthase [Chloroflexi bacterium AL-W]|nr:glutamine-hydrolyzing GMP synthase [Chloroflexi bacterium AL-N1]NOK71550.1 glutamine-hydrolyzing GMP synthase [Chloroflexi bacterium AL-N10]NOK78896.1 glutamine-hydrolyzing GMP synthase [Chloroflexi bacterium AL-N5]NOK86372.1 glutamine-hydrolyzing GMP synthase [Chloroflexi bacterium AL-W]NOK93341.1 glutamine-hydrolyzing GMP synthase [Chloroflexi bacterium AL-N15]